MDIHPGSVLQNTLWAKPLPAAEADKHTLRWARKSPPRRVRDVWPLRGPFVQGRHGQTGLCSAEVHQDGGIQIACPESRGLVIWVHIILEKRRF